jgi:two-component system sensor histidine kinase KdpD
MKSLRDCGWAVGAIAATTILGLLLYPVIGVTNLAMLYLLSVMVVALRLGSTPAICGSIAGALCLNFFFAEPRFSFAVLHSDDVVTLAVYLAAALVASRLGDQLREAEEKRVASEAEQLRAALLSSVSHDLRTPLAAILGSATSLRTQQDKLSAEARDELLETIEDEAQRLNRFVQNLLDMAKLGHGKLEPRRDWCDVQDLVRQARDRVGGQLAGLAVETQVEPDLGPVHVDPMLIEQVLINLLDNAAKYSPHRGTVRVAVRADGDAVVIDVEDEGPGIPAEDRERVFEPFRRARGGDHVKPGTGLGLSICRGLLAAHGGRIRALPGREGGALMRITLPRSPPPKVQASYG